MHWWFRSNLITTLPRFIGLFLTCLLTLLCFRLFNLIYSESVSEHQPSAPVRQTVKSERSNQVGQWVKYEIELSSSAVTPTQLPAGQITRFLVIHSLINQEKIKNRTYLREEFSILPLRITYQVLKDARTDLIKQIIFQRLGSPPMEIDPIEFSRLMGQPLFMVPSNATDWLIPDLSNSKESMLHLISQEKTICLLPESGKKLEVNWLTYSDERQTSRLMFWKSKDVPFTGLVKSVFISKDRSITITLLDFGLSGARSSLIAQPIKFGEKFGTIK